MTHRSLYTFFAALSMLSPLNVAAQRKGTALREQPLTFAAAHHDYLEAARLWTRSQNAAALSLDGMTTTGETQLSILHENGSFHRAQEGDQRNSLRFTSEQYRPVGRWLYGYGKFSYDMGRTHNRVWNDGWRLPEDATFSTGSSIPAKYDNQQFELNLRLATIELSNTTLGIGADYAVGDLSRLKDPRSRSTLLSYRIAPSATRSIGSHQRLGLSLYYQRRKEKIGNITTVQTDPNLAYYSLTGMEQSKGGVGAYKGFERQWVEHSFGGELSYGLHFGAYASIHSLSLQRSTEIVSEDRYAQPGRNFRFDHRYRSYHRWTKAHALHSLQTDLRLRQAYADEYLEELTQRFDSATSLTSQFYTRLLTYRQRDIYELLNTRIAYRYHWTKGAQLRGYVGVGSEYAWRKQQHRLPTSSFERSHWAVQVEGASWILPQLWAEAQLSYHAAIDSKLDLSNPTQPLATTVLQDDQRFFAANFTQIGFALRHDFALRLRRQPLRAFVRGSAQYLHSNQQRNAYHLGISLGLLN